MKKVIDFFKHQIFGIWEPLQRNFGEEPLVSEDSAASLKERIKQRYSGKNRGRGSLIGPYKDAHADHVIVKKK